MSDEFTGDRRAVELRAHDIYTEKRMDRIEQVLEKVVDNQVLLTTVEARGIEAAEAIRGIRVTLETHTIEVTTLKEKTKTLSWVTGVVTTAFIVALAAKFIDLI